MMNQTHKEQYRCPECVAVELKLKGIVALSDPSDYEDGGEF